MASVHEEYRENGIVKIRTAYNWVSLSHSDSLSMNKGYKYDILVWFCFDTLCVDYPSTGRVNIIYNVLLLRMIAEYLSLYKCGTLFSLMSKRNILNDLKCIGSGAFYPPMTI